MNEELYNSRDYCALAEELESLKKNYAKLEAQVVILKGMNFDFAGSLFKANKRIAELEAHIAALEEAAEIEEWDDFPNFPEPPEVK
ncbi:MAG: hypothetical protein GX465_15055 [Acidobacteria bacterium]|nr:hypothetical protein [Acidobacteriota bacterium]